MFSIRKSESAGAGNDASRPLFNVGYSVLDLKYQPDGQEQTLTVAVWYLTAAQPRPYQYGGPTNSHVAGKKDAGQLLTQSDPLLTRYAAQDVANSFQSDIKTPDAHGPCR